MTAAGRRKYFFVKNSYSDTSTWPSAGNWDDMIKQLKTRTEVRLIKQSEKRDDETKCYNNNKYDHSVPDLDQLEHKPSNKHTTPIRRSSDLSLPDLDEPMINLDSRTTDKLPQQISRSEQVRRKSTVVEENLRKMFGSEDRPKSVPIRRQKKKESNRRLLRTLMMQFGDSSDIQIYCKIDRRKKWMRSQKRSLRCSIDMTELKPVSRRCCVIPPVTPSTLDPLVEECAISDYEPFELCETILIKTDIGDDSPFAEYTEVAVHVIKAEVAETVTCATDFIDLTLDDNDVKPVTTLSVIKLDRVESPQLSSEPVRASVVIAGPSGLRQSATTTSTSQVFVDRSPFSAINTNDADRGLSIEPNRSSQTQLEVASTVVNCVTQSQLGVANTRDELDVASTIANSVTLTQPQPSVACTVANCVTQRQLGVASMVANCVTQPQLDVTSTLTNRVTQRQLGEASTASTVPDFTSATIQTSHGPVTVARAPPPQLGPLRPITQYVLISNQHCSEIIWPHLRKLHLFFVNIERHRLEEMSYLEDKEEQEEFTVMVKSYVDARVKMLGNRLAKSLAGIEVEPGYSLKYIVDALKDELKNTFEGYRIPFSAIYVCARINLLLRLCDHDLVATPFLTRLSADMQTHYNNHLRVFVERQRSSQPLRWTEDNSVMLHSQIQEFWRLVNITNVMCSRAPPSAYSESINTLKNMLRGSPQHVGVEALIRCNRPNCSIPGVRSPQPLVNLPHSKPQASVKRQTQPVWSSPKSAGQPQITAKQPNSVNRPPRSSPLNTWQPQTPVNLPLLQIALSKPPPQPVVNLPQSKRQTRNCQPQPVMINFPWSNTSTINCQPQPVAGSLRSSPQTSAQPQPQPVVNSPQSKQQQPQTVFSIPWSKTPSSANCPPQPLIGSLRSIRKNTNQPQPIKFPWSNTASTINSQRQPVVGSRPQSSGHTQRSTSVNHQSSPVIGAPRTSPSQTAVDLPPIQTVVGTSPPIQTLAGTSPPIRTVVETSSIRTLAGTSPPIRTVFATSPIRTLAGTSPPIRTVFGTSPPIQTVVGASPRPLDKKCGAPKSPRRGDDVSSVEQPPRKSPHMDVSPEIEVVNDVVVTIATSHDEIASSAFNDDDLIDLTAYDDDVLDEMFKDINDSIMFQVKLEPKIEDDTEDRGSPADSGMGSPPSQTSVENYKCMCGEDARYVCTCNDAMYCSKECQTRDWECHQKSCTPSDNN